MSPQQLKTGQKNKQVNSLNVSMGSSLLRTVAYRLYLAVCKKVMSYSVMIMQICGAPPYT